MKCNIHARQSESIFFYGDWKVNSVRKIVCFVIQIIHVIQRLTKGFKLYFLLCSQL